MAERRMFAKTIIDSDAFLDMPLSAQSLYFHLNMRADDDGFVNNPKKIQRMIGASDDDLKLLIAKKFILVFDSGIIVIKHWKIHNYIRGDRKKMTTYSEEMAMLETKKNGSYTFGKSVPSLEENAMSDNCQSSDSQVTVKCQSSDSQMSAQVRLGKDSIGKDSIGKNRKDASADEVGKMIDEFSSGDSQLSDSLWAFYDMRKKIKKPLNPYAMKLILNKLREFSDDAAVQVQILNESIVNNWQSVYPLKERKQEMPKGYAPQPTIGEDERRSLEWMKQFRARKEAEQRDNQ